MDRTDYLVLHTKKASSGCVEWQLFCDGDGYGRIHLRTKPDTTIGAHRLSYTAFVGDVPQGLLVLHTCDNPRCVNPCHLFLGTHLDNALDKVAKGRAVGGSSPGERNPSCTLTVDEVRSIKLRLRRGELARVIANDTGRGLTTIRDIRDGRTWANVRLDDVL